MKHKVFKSSVYKELHQIDKKKITNSVITMGKDNSQKRKYR